VIFVHLLWSSVMRETSYSAIYTSLHSGSKESWSCESHGGK